MKNLDRYKMPTPRTLDEAVQQMLQWPVCELREHAYNVLRDFLAQKFGVATLVAGDDPKVLEVIEKLFDSCVARDEKDVK